MESGLKGWLCRKVGNAIFVSILVLMESGLKGSYHIQQDNKPQVSILVLMESGLKEKVYAEIVNGFVVFVGFNPCFNGKRS